jgi:hypothetical protein
MNGQAEDVEAQVTAAVFGEVKASFGANAQRNGIIAATNALAAESSSSSYTIGNLATRNLLQRCPPTPV